MRLARCLALVLGLGAIVIAGIGLAMGRVEARHALDARVTTLAEVAATEISGLVERAVVAAELAVDPDDFVRAFTIVGPLEVVAAAVRDTARPAGVVELGFREDAVVVVAAGSAVLGSVDVPLETLAARASNSDATLSLVPVDSLEAPFPGWSADGSPWTADGRRTQAVLVTAAPGWAVVATVADVPTLDVAERNRLLAVALAGVLLVGAAAVGLRSQQRRLVERATVDPLTRLPNRSELEARGAEMVELAHRAGDGACVMVVDLDGFKQVNDVHGHAAGDEVLRVIGLRLRHAVRGYDLVGRWGGDEFVVLLSGVSDAEIAVTRAAALATSVSRPIEARPGPRPPSVDAPSVDAPSGLRVGASVGVAMLGVHGVDLDTLLAAADAAMYEAKRNGLDLTMAPVPEAVPVLVDDR